jgi:predicted Zn-dependent protease
VPVDPDVLRALEVVVQREPQNLAIALHLGELLLASGRPAEALRLARTVLATAPADPRALELEAQAQATLARTKHAGLRLLKGDG